MKAKNCPSRALSLSLLLLTGLALSPLSSARTIYQYIDEQGAMAFSDSPPDFTNDYMEIEVADAPDPAPTTTEDEFDKMVEVTEKLEAKRREREEARRQQEAEKTPPQPYYPPQEPDYDRGYYYPGYVNHIPDDPVIRRQHELRVPLRIPAFGTGQSYQDRIESYPELNQR